MPLALPVDHIVSGRYRLASALGHGGMGVVYKAEDLALRRFVALKIIPAETGGGDRPPTDDRERVLREASLTAQINHPNVVTIHDYGCVEAGADSYCYIAMELLSGETLGERLRRQRTGLSRAETILVMTQVVRGLRAAHRRGLVHRDLKPDNIMLTPGDDGDDSVRILDFGLAREMIPGPARGFGDGGDVAGTPEYMSPEQVAGREVDYRADLYAFGILLYECVTGAPPFTGDNPFRVARSHVRDAVPPMRIPGARWRPSLAFQELVRKLLEKRPVARIQTADDLLHRLSDLPEARAVRAVETVQLPTFVTRSRYQTHQKLSETPRAIVYEATHDVLGRRVALKVFRSPNPPDPARVLRDLSALALLRHPSNVRVHDAGTTATGPLGLPFVVMERVHGPTLRALLTKERRLSPARAARLLASALDG
ncbi:MAG: protein kinase, partial [Polyangiaceae bacterium]